MITKIDKYLDQSVKDIKHIRNQKEKITKIISLLKGKNVFVCGNGGSSATASHLVNDLVKICNINARCLSDNVPLLTAYANDDAYEYVFTKQLMALAKNGDVLIVISGSGNSPNIINVTTWAHLNKLYTIAFLGMDGGILKNSGMLTEYIHVPTDMLHSEDMHLIVSHLISYEGGNL
jgi:D-sedoheptulose 7-phosphate isomerase